MIEYDGEKYLTATEVARRFKISRGICYSNILHHMQACYLPGERTPCKQNRCMSSFKQTEWFDQMSEQQSTPPPSSLSALQVFALRIETQTPHLHVLDIHEFPRPFIQVRDTEDGIVVGFSSEADYVTYCQIVSRRRV